jgi:thiol-disulfide isomerase/thioredoxin
MPLRMDSDMPSLEGGTDWFNSQPIEKDSLAGHPVLIHFWSISCGTCKEAFPDIEAWISKYEPLGLKVVSVHMPRQESDTNVPSVKECIDEYEIKQACVVDNWHTITDAFENKFVPAYYLFDSAHKMRHFSAGEKAVKMVEPALERLLNSQEATQSA